MFVRHTLTATGTLFCEEIADAVDNLLAKPVYQEQFTQALADRLGCKVRTRCRHLHDGRVRTDCVCRRRPALAADAA